MPPPKTATALTTVHMAIWYSNRALSPRNLPIAYAELPAHTIAKMRSPDAVKLAALLGSKTFAGILLTSTPLMPFYSSLCSHFFYASLDKFDDCERHGKKNERTYEHPKSLLVIL